MAARDSHGIRDTGVLASLLSGDSSRLSAFMFAPRGYLDRRRREAGETSIPEWRTSHHGSRTGVDTWN